MKVGGVAGLGSSESKCVISLDKQRFTPGEKIRVHFELDNTDCKKPVKNFKIKLVRKIQCFSGKKGAGAGVPLLTNQEYIVVKKYEGCAEKVRETRTNEFMLPVADTVSPSTQENLHPELRPMIKLLSDSVENSLFKVEYYLEIFVKHLSKLEFGMGNSVMFPIEIRSEGQPLPFFATREQDWMTHQSIEQWTPNYCAPQVWLTHALEADGTYRAITTQADGSQQQYEHVEPAYDYQAAELAAQEARRRAEEEARWAHEEEMRLQRMEEEARAEQERREHEEAERLRWEEEVRLEQQRREQERLDAEAAAQAQATGEQVSQVQNDEFGNEGYF